MKVEPAPLPSHTSIPIAMLPAASAMMSPPAEDPNVCVDSHKRKAAEEPAAETAPPPKVRTVTSASTALSRNETTQEGRATIRDEQLATLFGIRAATRDFSTADKKAWTKQERTTYNFQCQMHGPSHASAFMRRYFKENEGKPLPPLPPPRSAYAVFRAERFAEIGCSAGGFKGTGSAKKNYSKQVGGEWRQLSEEQQQPYEDVWASKTEEHNAATEAYEAALEEWEQQKERATQ